MKKAKVRRVSIPMLRSGRDFDDSHQPIIALKDVPSAAEVYGGEPPPDKCHRHGDLVSAGFQMQHARGWIRDLGRGASPPPGWTAEGLRKWASTIIADSADEIAETVVSLPGYEPEL